MHTIQIPPEVLDALERAIIHAVQDRIDNDPDVADTYLRVSAIDNRFTVRVMYLEESNASQPNRDMALLNLMTDTGFENWVPDNIAIHEYAQSFGEMIEFNYCQN